MTLAGKKLTFEEYLTLQNTGLEGRAEWVDGELIELPPESGFNTDITGFMFAALLGIGIPISHLKIYVCEVQVPILEARDPANRYPDLVVLRDEHIPLTRNRMTITLEMPPPRLVMEVVSPGKTNRDRDYICKRAQYEAIAIPEYLIVDPQEQVVIVLRLEGDAYQENGRYQGDELIKSLEFLALSLTATQILSAGN